jgi:hypothetical protein
MLFRELRNESPAQAESGTPGGPETANLDQLRQAGESLFRAADEAINRALSGDSVAFLRATQQEGGQ